MTTSHGTARSAPGASGADVLRHLGSRRGALRALVSGYPGPVLLVPAQDIVFAILGDPSGELDLAWLAHRGEYRLRELARGRGIPSSAASEVIGRLRWALASHATAPRQTASISGREVEIVLSGHLAAELRRVVTEVLS